MYVCIQYVRYITCKLDNFDIIVKRNKYKFYNNLSYSRDIKSDKVCAKRFSLHSNTLFLIFYLIIRYIIHALYAKIYYLLIIRL